MWKRGQGLVGWGGGGVGGDRRKRKMGREAKGGREGGRGIMNLPSNLQNPWAGM